MEKLIKALLFIPAGQMTAAVIQNTGKTDGSSLAINPAIKDVDVRNTNLMAGQLFKIYYQYMLGALKSNAAADGWDDPPSAVNLSGLLSGFDISKLLPIATTLLGASSPLLAALTQLIGATVAPAIAPAASVPDLQAAALQKLPH